MIFDIKKAILHAVINKACCISRLRMIYSPLLDEFILLEL